MAEPRSAPLAAALEVDPFTALAVHFGMLLGVSDFQVLAANPRGKAALHQSWQHGKGVVWGYPVRVADRGADLVVGPGLCIDGLGREVTSGVDLCLDVRAWLDEQTAAGTVVPRENGPRRSFDAQLWVRHEACLSRPVPSVQPGYAGADQSPAYSRVLELAHLELRPYKSRPGDDRDRVFAALRAFVRDGLLPDGVAHRQSRLDEFRAVVADLVAALGPPGLVPQPQSERTRLFVEDEPGEVLLADLPGLTVVRLADGGWRLDAPTIDLSVRRTHVPTWVLSELLGELLDGGSCGSGGCASDARGPRVERIRLSGATVTVKFRGRVVAATVPGAVQVRAFEEATGWGDPVPLNPSVADEPAGSVLTFDLPVPPSDTVTYRLVLAGTGPTPLVGLVDGRPVPLAGLVGDPPGSRAQGRDVVRRLPGRGAVPPSTGTGSGGSGSGGSGGGSGGSGGGSSGSEPTGEPGGAS
jgi:hypothetical protein